MIAGLIRWSARNIFLIALAAIFLTLAGVYAVSRVPLDAIPDLSDVQVIIYTRVPRPSAAGGRGPSDLSAHHGDAERAKITCSAQILFLRRLVRLHHL